MVFDKMRYRINCIIISLLVAVALLIIVINVHELRELKRSVNNRLHDTYSVTSKPIDRNHAITTTSTRNAWVYPENVSDVIIHHHRLYASGL